MIFPAIARFQARRFYEKWKYLPVWPGKIFHIRQFLPGAMTFGKILARTDFPRPGKIDV
jgi:hypothetical protein